MSSRPLGWEIALSLSTFSTVHHVMDYSLAVNSSLSVRPGIRGRSTFSLRRSTVLANTLSLSCGHLPAYATCTFSNPSPSLSSGQSVDVQITLGTSSSTTAQNSRACGCLQFSLAFLLPGVLVLFRKRVRPVMLLIVVSLALMGVSACGGGGSGGGARQILRPRAPPVHTPSRWVRHRYQRFGREHAGAAHRDNLIDSYAVVGLGRAARWRLHSLYVWMGPDRPLAGKEQTTAHFRCGSQRGP